MPATLTLKNVPDQIVERLKRAALENRRSMNSEAIVRLETALVPVPMAPQQRLERARELRASLNRARFRASDIDQLKRQGRA